MLRVLYVSDDMGHYTAAMYQNDVIKELSRQLGENFSRIDVLEFRDLIRGSRNNNFTPDVVILGHSFLEDNPVLPLSRVTTQDILSYQDAPVIAFLNKEYSRLEEKIKFFENAGVTALISHLWDLARFKSSLPIFHLPFAANVDFLVSNPHRSIDLNFSGVLRNPTFPGSQSDFRERVFRTLFVTIFGVVIRKRSKFKDVRIYWYGISGRRFVDLLNQQINLFASRRDSTNDYARRLGEAKITLNGPSPMFIVGTRFYECMASGSVVLTPDFPGLRETFPDSDKIFLIVKDDLSDFEEVLLGALRSDLDFRREAAQEAFKNSHTWEVRITELIDWLTSQVGRKHTS